ncbi:MAG: MauE/DoxX family redox-associated membrane protein [Myxococcota bacterium]
MIFGSELDPAVIAAAAWLLAVVVGSAGIHKLLHVDAFRGVMRDYRLFPEALTETLIRVVPIFEVTLAGLLLLAQTRTLAGTLTASLLAVYGFAIGINLARGRTHIDCGCSWNAEGQPLSGWLLLRNAGLVGLGLLSTSTPTPRALGLVDAAVIAATTVTGLLLYFAAEQLLANHARIKMTEAIP